MTNRASVSPPNSLLLVTGTADPEPPEEMNGVLISRTPTCIAVGTLSAADGPTTVELRHHNEDDDRGPAVWHGSLRVYGRELRVVTVTGDIILSSPVDGDSVDVTIFANHTSEPDNILVEYQASKHST